MEETTIQIGENTYPVVLIDGEQAICATNAAAYSGLTPATFTRKRAEWDLKGYVNKADTRRIWFKVCDLDNFKAFVQQP